MSTSQPGPGPAPDRDGDPRPPSAVPPQHQITRTRLGGLWVALTAGAIVLLLLLIFILENSHSVDVAYFGVHGHLPLGVALLLAAVCGVLLVLIPGAGRIIQLRRTARKHRAMDQKAVDQENVATPGQPVVPSGPEQPGVAPPPPPLPQQRPDVPASTEPPTTLP